MSIFLRPEAIHIGNHSRLDGLIKVEGGKGVKLGEYVHIASFSHLNVGGGQLIFEDHSGCSSHCSIGSATPDWSFLYISAAEPSEHHHVVRYLTRICCYALLGMGVIVLPGRTIGEGAVVKPGSVVVDDVTPWSIVQGNPAKRVGGRVVSEHKRYLLEQREFAK